MSLYPITLKQAPRLVVRSLRVPTIVQNYVAAVRATSVVVIECGKHRFMDVVSVPYLKPVAMRGRAIRKLR